MTRRRRPTLREVACALFIIIGFSGCSGGGGAGFSPGAPGSNGGSPPSNPAPVATASPRPPLIVTPAPSPSPTASPTPVVVVVVAPPPPSPVATTMPTATPPPVPVAPTPTPQPTATPVPFGPLTVTPPNLALTGTSGASSMGSLTLSETNYGGAFTESDTCANIATFTPAASAVGPSATYGAQAVGAGTCVVTFRDDHGGSVTSTIQVTTFGLIIQSHRKAVN